VLLGKAGAISDPQTLYGGWLEVLEATNDSLQRGLGEQHVATLTARGVALGTGDLRRALSVFPPGIARSRRYGALQARFGTCVPGDAASVFAVYCRLRIRCAGILCGSGSSIAR
jgi:hypothetical protein